MEQFVVNLGIEHLMTGVKVRSPKGDVLTFERESSSVVRVLSDSPIEVYWPVKQSWITSHEVAQGWKGDERYSEGEAEWTANVMAHAMRDADTQADRSDTPFPVIRAMRRKFGKNADEWIAELEKHYGGMYSFNYAGMFHGVEPDGHIHT